MGLLERELRFFTHQRDVHAASVVVSESTLTMMMRAGLREASETEVDSAKSK